MKIPLSPIRCLYRAVDIYGSKTGVVSEEESYTYQEFGERCERMAAGLVGIGASAGDRIAFLSFNTVALLEAYFAVPMANAILLPLNVRLKPDELAIILKHSQPTVLFYELEFEPVIQQLRSMQLGIARYVSIGGSSVHADLTVAELMQHGRISRADPFSYDGGPVDEDSPAELFYTSGSTGVPKGVLLSHRSLYLHALGLASTLDNSDTQVMLHSIPLFHANGWGFPQMCTLCGIRQVILRRFEPRLLLQLVERERITRMIVVPTMATMLLNFQEIDDYDHTSLREIIIGGAAASLELVTRLERRFRCRAFAGYGLSETGPVITIARPKSSVVFRDDIARRRFAAATGWPVIGAYARVVDTHGNDLPRDGKSIGEIVARGDGLMSGYFREPEMTEANLKDGWLYTGDMAVWSDDYLQIVDRSKDIIVSGGENIASIEIEQAICQHPAVVECAVVAAPHPRWGEAPAAIVVLRPGVPLTEQELLDFLTGKIASYKLPRFVTLTCDPLPKTGSGKILKRELRERFWEGHSRRVQG